MASQSPDAEILVHVTAPSRAADDVVYRQLAHAYLAFEPQTRTRLPLVDAADEAPQTQPFVAPAHSSFQINSQDLSSEDVLDNRESPRICVHRYVEEPGLAADFSHESGAASQTSWCAPPSQIGDSFPPTQPGPVHISPTTALRRYVGRQGPSGDPPPSSSSSPAEETRELGASQSTDSAPPSSWSASKTSANRIIPVTPYGTKTGLKRKQAPTAQDQQGEQETFLLDATHISSTNLSIAPLSSAESEPIPSSLLGQDYRTPASLEVVCSSDDVGPLLSSSDPAVQDIANSLEILPPPPPVGVVELTPSDLISPKLAKLTRDLSSRYRPELRRVVVPFERGYWLLDCSGWTAKSRLDTWVFLNNYLQSGLAGWGTWCRRDELHQRIRLYCWGFAVKHTYLLLYVASARRLKATRAAWYGADAELAIEVPPHDRQS